ncbi:tetratricopeptide repeat protein [Candidatus Leptofilum sp.]|uniref:tetratricopeptide repeat protein n=1 Tax=Candidatus Leptofilum sp. TaxID=3241576 RepID=UPI003B5B85E1
MTELANDRWFPVFNTGLALATASLWYFSSGRIGWPLIVAILVPWGLRIAAGRFPYRQSRFDGWLFLFGVTAVFSTFTAYSSEVAAGKFWILVGAMAVFLAIVSVSRRDVWLLAGASGPVGALLAIYFVMSNNWRQWPADIGIFNRIGMAWMSLRPSFPLPVLHPNTLAGMMALLFPFTVAFALFAWHKRQIRWLQLAAVSGVVTAGGLIFTSSLGAWLALAVGLSIWGLWWGSGQLQKRTPFSQKIIFAVLMSLLFLVGLVIFRLILGSGLGQEDSSTRLGLAQQTYFLIQDFALTGGGLGSFPALYAQYAQVTPSFFAAYSNLYFDIWLEQGFLALVAMVMLLGGGFWLLFKRSAWRQPIAKKEPTAETILATAVPHRRKRRRRQEVQASEMVWFQWATFVSLVAMALHGLIDDALYGNLASPLLFFAPAMAIVVTRRRSDKAPTNGVRRQRWAWGLGATAVFLVGLFFGFRQTVQAQWYANLGALELARAELVGWPTNQWDAGENLERFEPATAQFERALAIDPQNRTAHHRLGLIALVERDFETAVAHLEQAHEQAPNYRGIVKTLGYSYVWLGQFDQAAEILAIIPEARAEMNIYNSWWERQNRPDLATKAGEMASILENATASK